MKKKLIAGLPLSISILFAGCGDSTNASSGFGLIFLAFLAGVLGVVLLAVVLLRVYSGFQYSRRAKNRHRQSQRHQSRLTVLMAIAAALFLLICYLLATWEVSPAGKPNVPDDSESGSSADTSDSEPTVPPNLYSPGKTEDSDPSKWGIRWEIFENGSSVDSYTRQNPISFAEPDEYFALPGISTFRGNPYRDGGTYGTANVSDKTLKTVWTTQTSTLDGGTWSGSGWTGQPLIVQWDEQTKSIMNLYEAKKAKKDLVEVIYATLDGRIYFLDLDDGSYTRDPIEVGLCFKGAGSLDPRGYPLMYVGSGDVNLSGERPRMYIISLIDGTILYQYGHEDSLSYRQDNDNWCAFDSSPLVDAGTDTLIWPGESGLLYTIHLNTQYDRTAGTISISPDTPVLTRYDTSRSNKETYWYGYEASANIVENYLYVSENGGLFYCVDLNTMELVWAQDTKDDSNSSPVFERASEKQGYIYTAPSLHWTRNSDAEGQISIYKLNSITGEILWQRPYQVHTIEGVSGGVQSTPLLGRADSAIDGLIIYTIARIPTEYAGIMVALDTETGKEVWRMDMDMYTWSSPTAVYDASGNAYIVVCDAAGYVALVDGTTGELLYRSYIGGVIEATPAIFNDRIVIGTRSEQICCIEVH